MSTFDQITLNYGILGAIPSTGRSVLATFRHMLYTKTDLQFYELVAKILTITSREQTTEWNYFRTAKDKTIRQDLL